MADEYERSVLPVDDALRGRDIIGKARKRFLDDAHVISVFFEDVINAAPCRTVGIGAMYQYNILHRLNLCNPILSVVPVNERNAPWPTQMR
jgi:hypothetical protein